MSASQYVTAALACPYCHVTPMAAPTLVLDTGVVYCGSCAKEQCAGHPLREVPLAGKAGADTLGTAPTCTSLAQFVLEKYNSPEEAGKKYSFAYGYNWKQVRLQESHSTLSYCPHGPPMHSLLHLACDCQLSARYHCMRSS